MQQMVPAAGEKPALPEPPLNPVTRHPSPEAQASVPPARLSSVPRHLGPETHSSVPPAQYNPYPEHPHAAAYFVAEAQDHVPFPHPHHFSPVLPARSSPVPRHLSPETHSSVPPAQYNPYPEHPRAAAQFVAEAQDHVPFPHPRHFSPVQTPQMPYYPFSAPHSPHHYSGQPGAAVEQHHFIQDPRGSVAPSQDPQGSAPPPRVPYNPRRVSSDPHTPGDHQAPYSGSESSSELQVQAVQRSNFGQIALPADPSNRQSSPNYLQVPPHHLSGGSTSRLPTFHEELGQPKVQAAIPIAMVTPPTPVTVRTAVPDSGESDCQKANPVGRLSLEETAAMEASILRMETYLAKELEQLTVKREQYIKFWLKSDSRTHTSVNRWNAYAEYFKDNIEEELCRVPDATNLPRECRMLCGYTLPNQ